MLFFEVTAEVEETRLVEVLCEEVAVEELLLEVVVFCEVVEEPLLDVAGLVEEVIVELLLDVAGLVEEEVVEEELLFGTAGLVEEVVEEELLFGAAGLVEEVVEELLDVVGFFDEVWSAPIPTETLPQASSSSLSSDEIEEVPELLPLGAKIVD